MAKAQRIDADPLLLEAALEGLEIRKRQIEDQIQNVRTLLGKNGAVARKPPVSETKPVKRDMSPEARKRIAAAQKKRWAEFRRRAKAS